MAGGTISRVSIEDREPAGFGYLTSPPEGRGLGPTETRPQLLQLSSLLPKDFERLCFRLIRLRATVEQCRPYGVHGQAQHGIDLYARRIDGSYMVVQCKRSSDGFDPGEVTAAVDVFLAGDWADRTAVFVLAVTANLEGTKAADRIENERKRLAARGIKFEVWDQIEVSALMKGEPRLVDDFFGREALRTFLGSDAADVLGDRLDAAEVMEYRLALRTLYTEVFGRLERGVHGDDRNVPLQDRFVCPDVIVSTGTGAPVSVPDAPRPGSTDMELRFGPVSWTVPDVSMLLRNRVLKAAESRATPVRYGTRMSATDWLGNGDWHLFVGVPGSGKSALLRTFVLDMLSDERQFIARVDQLHDLLPVWLPFAFWTRAARLRPEAASVLDAVHEWLHHYDHGDLWPLIQKALNDERLLLVVDGLDEWASPEVARLCVDRLEVFARTKHARVLASSRPFSTTELPITSSRWRLGTLAPLDHEQRRALITKWLAALIAEPSLTREAADWDYNIESSAHLRELSDLPLFLLLLLRSREQMTEFPEDKYAVLDEAIKRLVGEHRKRKIDVANAADVFPTSGDIRKISAAVAEHMHTSTAVSISDDSLRELFRHTLAESIGYPPAEAHTIATTLVNSLSPGIGLMVRPAPDDTQFFHRSVLEFLAAERMLTRPNPEQVELFCGHLAERRWGQVLRFLLRGLARPQEVTAVFDALDRAGVNDPLLREHADLLAADLVVSAGPADAHTRRRLFDRVVQEIEAGERISHRAKLIDRLLTGLSRREVRSGLQARFEGWLRGVSPWRWGAVLSAASAWEPDETLLNMLWHALLDDNDQVHRVAGRVIGTRFAGSDSVADQLATLAATTRLPHRRAAATEALSLGWPRHEGLDALIATGCNHPDFAVRHASIAADLRRGNVNDDNRSAFIDLLDHAPSATAWSDGLMELMFIHYRDDQAIFEHYVPHADPTTTDQLRYDAVPAMLLILKGYTARPEAKQCFLKFIAADRKDFPTTPSNLTDHVPWKEIAEVYRHDDEVVAAVERLVGEYDTTGFYNRDIYFCSQVARTTSLRDNLIARINDTHNFGVGWAIKALIEGWPHDPTVQAALRQIIDSDGDPAASLEAAIWFLPDIIADPDAALDRLASLSDRIEHQGAVIHALGEIVEGSELRDDPRVTAIIDHALTVDMSHPWTSPEAALYTAFADHPRVRELALARLDDRDTPLDRIAYGFRDDEQMRHHIADRFRALSPPLRGRLVEGLAETPASDAAVTAVLARYDLEPDPAVKLLAAAAYAGRLQSTGTITDEIVDVFTEQAQATGHDHQERRAAAFAALARSARLDRLSGLPVQISSPVLGDRTLFSRTVCQRWDDVKATFGANLARRLGSDTGDSEFWQNVLAVAHDYPATRDDLAAILQEQPGLIESAAGLAYLSRVEPGSRQLWEATTQLLGRASADTYINAQRAWTGLHILVEQYADDPRTATWLTLELAHAERSKAVYEGRTYLRMPSFGTVAAIARLRPNHPVVKELLAQAQRVQGEPWHRFPEWTELAAATASSAPGFVSLAVEVIRIVKLNDLAADYVHRPLTSRLRRDPALASGVAEYVPQLSAATAGIAVRLLSMSGRVEGSLAEHLWQRLTSRSDESLDTFDPLSGRAGHLELLTLDIFDTIEP